MSDVPTAPAPIGKFVIVAELRSMPSGPFEAAIAGLGSSYRLSANVWIVRAATTAGAVRNGLSPFLGSRDSLFVLEGGTARTAWLNLGPEADARIRAIFQSEPKAT